VTGEAYVFMKCAVCGEEVETVDQRECAGCGRDLVFLR
jgi:ribosomal protein L37E